MTALVSLSAGGAIAGFSFIPKAAADFSSPTSLPLNLVALRQTVQPPQPDRAAPDQDTMLRAAVVHVADYYLRMAQTKTPAEMEAVIWQHDSIDGVDHGESCAAFASLTLELGAQVVGRESWVSGGGSYPWPLHQWADVRVDPNPASLGITSILQDAQAHDRWHPLGDGYRPLPGDWVLFDGHVEVVTKDTSGVLHTVGGDSLPNFSVNAHEYPEPLSAAGVVGFVNNGSLPGAAEAGAAEPGAAQPSSAQPSSAQPGAASAAQASHHGSGRHQDTAAASGGRAAIPGAVTATAARGSADPAIPGLVAERRSGSAGRAQGTVPAANAAPAAKAAPVAKAAQPDAERLTRGAAAIPGVAGDSLPLDQGTAYRRHHPSPVSVSAGETRAEQVFISEVAPGAIEAQHRYGVPAAVTIAQAIDESGWGQSELAAQDHNLFGIKGTGPAGSVPLPTQEYVNGQSVSTSASFRVYHSVAESIDDHGRLLASSPYYQQAMGYRQHPDKFAEALTGVYATDPEYGASLIRLMRSYDLYRYGAADQGQPAQGPVVAEPGSATIPGVPAAHSTPHAAAGSRGWPRTGTGHPRPVRTSSPQPTRTGSPQPTPTGTPQPSSTSTPQPNATGSPQPSRTSTPQPGPTGSAQPSHTGTPQPGPTGSPQPSHTGTPQPSHSDSPQPARTDSPGPTPTATPSSAASTSTASPSRSASAPAPAPASASAPASAPAAAPAPASAPASDGQSASIPGVSTQSESARRLGAARARPAAATLRDAAPARRSDPPVARATLVSTHRYHRQVPRPVLNSFVETAKAPLLAGQATYQDVAERRGIGWQLLAACDWMQCDARSRRSPVYGERLGTVNEDGTVYVQRSAALGRCADDLVSLSRTVYGVDLTRRELSVRDLANAFAAFRWGGLLKAHDCSAMEFPYSVAGLTEQHVGMRWPRITDPGNGDRPGGRFHRRFGAVPIVLSLDYPAIE